MGRAGEGPGPGQHPAVTGMGTLLHGRVGEGLGQNGEGRGGADSKKAQISTRIKFPLEEEKRIIFDNKAIYS